MGAVWRAWDERLERWVALKEVRAGTTLQHGRERLWREARAVARLSHPSIVQVFDILEGTDDDWIVMELVEGKTVRCLLDEGALPPECAIKICREVAEGLVEAHAQGVLHRDLKATNVIVASSGRAKILDFGLAKIPREEHPEGRDLTLSSPGLILGTCYAMSPEQALGQDLDERSDLFSLGSLLYEMLTGEAPFRAESDVLSLGRVVHHRQPSLERSHPAVPPGICELVDWLLQKRPEDRPQSAVEVMAALATAAAPSSLNGRATPPRSAPPSRLDGPAESTLFDRPYEVAQRRTPDDGYPQSGGERRTVTIVCCALVPLDRPAGGPEALEIEALSAAAVAFENLGRQVCRELSGFLCAAVNRTLGLCFGYPRAHEDDVERAVRAAVELQTRFAALPIPAAGRVAVRTGVHTGSAITMNLSGSGSTLQPGDTFDIAMAIQSHVPVGRIGVSAASRRILGRKFRFEPLSEVRLDDLDATVAVYELGPRVAPESGESSSEPSPMVDREIELQILLDRFRLAVSGSGQAVLIAGEAGIGKSRLARALSERLAAEATWLTVYGSTFAQNTPLAPVIHLLSRAIFSTEDSAENTAEDRLRRLERVLDEHGLARPDYVPLLGELLSLPVQGYPALVLSPEARRKRTLAAVVALLGAVAEQRPVALVVEDLHWIDPSTLDFLDLLLGEIPVLPVLLVATFRPEFVAPWRHQTSVTQLSLSGLGEAHVAQLVAQVAGERRLTEAVQREIVARTDGIPLFVEELTKAVLETEAPLRQPADIPFTLGGSLLARLDRLGDAKAVAQLAAVIGRTFSLELLEAFSRIKGAALHGALGQLLQAEILHRRGPARGMRYIFRHALIQDAAYLSLLASDRELLHRRLARLLENEFREQAEAEPELMAHHCERGGLVAEAVQHLQAAGRRAVQRSAHQEAVSHLYRALDLLSGLPAAPERVAEELALRVMLFPALAAAKGWGAPEVAVNAGRLVALSRELGDLSLLIPSLYGLWAHHLLRGDRGPTSEVAAEIARLAETPVQVFIGCSTRVITSFYQGRFAEALALVEPAEALFEPNALPEFTQAYGEESSLAPHTYGFWVLWILGRSDAALRKKDAVLAAVEALHAPFPLVFALLFEMILWHELRVPEQVAAVAERMIGHAREQEFAWMHSTAQIGHGWAACQRGDLAGGTAEIQAGLDLMASTGGRLPRGYFLSYLIEVHLAAGRLDEGLAAVREALSWSETQLDVFFDSELLRLEGELLRASGASAAAEASFGKGLAIARAQGARSFELRIAVSRVRLLEEQGRAGEALPALAAVHQTFHEGLATFEVLEASRLLDRFSGPSVRPKEET
jgi:class 3 adenylate cyclase/tetratricopeptide (TPR) repeat protein